MLSSEETGTRYGRDRKLFAVALLVRGPPGDRYEAPAKLIGSAAIPSDTEVDVLVDPQAVGSDNPFGACRERLSYISFNK